MIFLQGCSDNSTVNILDEKIIKNKIKCMRLVVFPPDEMLERVLQGLYSFDKTCSLELEVSKKSGIVCTSNQNTQKKVLNSFPTSYLRMQIKDQKLLYSYYIDLKDDVTNSDIKRAFARIKKDLKF